MKKILLAFAFCFAALSAFSSYAAEPRQAPTEQERARTVYIFHQPIVMLQAKFGLTRRKSAFYASATPCAILPRRMCVSRSASSP